MAESDKWLFQFDYDYAVKIYTQLMDTQHIFVAITGVKALAVLLLLLVWYNKFFGYVDESKGEAKMPITMSDIYKGILIMCLIAGYDQILTVLDRLLGAIEGEYLVNAVKSNAAWENEEISANQAEKSWMDYIKEASSYVIDNLVDPFWWILKILEAICFLIDKLLYGIIIYERFFFLGLLRVFGGFCIACLMVEKLSSFFWNWLKLYIALYLLIIPIFLINRFCNAIYDSYYNELHDGGMDMTSSLMIIVLIFTVALKTRLFAKAQPILFKIFS